MLWFNFILGINFIFPCFKLIIIHYRTQKQRKIQMSTKDKSELQDIYFILIVSAQQDDLQAFISMMHMLLKIDLFKKNVT